MFSTGLEIIAAAEENRLEELNALRWIHALPEIIFSLRCLHAALDRKRQRAGELACIGAELTRIVSDLSTPRI